MYAYVCMCMHVYTCVCVHVCVCASTGFADGLKCSLAGPGWECRRYMSKNPGLRVVSLFCIITRALGSCRALCHPSPGQGTSNPGMVYPLSGEGARDCFFTACLPSFCPRGQMEGSVAGQPSLALPQAISPKPSAPRKQLAKAMSYAGVRWSLWR